MATLESRFGRLEEAYENLATKDDLTDLEERMTAHMATKEDMADLEERMATKEDMADLEERMTARMATKDDLERFATKEDLERFATKEDLERFATKEDLERLATKDEVNQLRVDIGPIKAAYVSDKAKIEALFIAQDMGFKYARTLNLVDMFALTDGQDLSGISRGDLRSFHRADLIMQVTDSQGAESYIAVEMSYTADERDTTRAVRNAEYLERFTGRPARAAIAGLRRDRRIEAIDPSDVFWYELPDSIMEVE